MRLKSQTGLHLQKNWRIMWALVGVGKVLDYKNFSHGV